MSNSNRNRNLIARGRGASAPIPVNIKNALKSMAKQSNKASVLVKGPNDPPSIKRDILVSKVVETLTAATGGPTTYTNAGIYALLDTQATPFFTHMRVIKVSVFGPPSTGSSTSQPNVSVSINYDGAFFLDRGVGTARTACLHVRLPELIRETWVSTTDTTGVCIVQTTGTVVQFSIEVRADTAGDT